MLFPSTITTISESKDPGGAADGRLTTLHIQDAAKALASAHDKPFRGRTLVVTYAHQAPLDQAGGSSVLGVKRKSMMESGRPTTLSMIKGRHKDKYVFHLILLDSTR